METELEDIKKKIQVMKDKKNERNKLEFKDQSTQIEKVITTEDTKRFIDLEDKALIVKIEKLMKIKETEIARGKNPELVYQEVHPILNEYLFQLLVIVASGIEFISWADYMLIDDQKKC